MNELVIEDLRRELEDSLIFGIPSFLGRVSVVLTENGSSTVIREIIIIIIIVIGCCAGTTRQVAA